MIGADIQGRRITEKDVGRPAVSYLLTAPPKGTGIRRQGRALRKAVADKRCSGGRGKERRTSITAPAEGIDIQHAVMESSGIIASRISVRRISSASCRVKKRMW